MNVEASRQSAYLAIKKNGCAISIKKIINGEMDYDTGKMAQAEELYDGYALLTGSITDIPKDSVVNSNIRWGDKKAIIPAHNLGCVPTEGDSLVIGTNEHAIIFVNPLSPSNIPILYKIVYR